MNIHQLALRYYLRQAWSFEEMLHNFFSYGDASFQSQKTNIMYSGYAPMYLKVLQRIINTDHRNTTGNQGMIVELPDKEVIAYFEKSYCENQLFCIMFAHWYGLPPKQIKILANRKYQNKCYSILEYFLFNQSMSITDNQSIIDRLKEPFKKMDDEFLLFDKNAPSPIRLIDAQVVEMKPLMIIQHYGFGENIGELYKEVDSGETFVLIG